MSKNVVEGGVHVITNFYTKEALGSLRPTSAGVVINFSNSTTVGKIETDEYMIPINEFEFSDLTDLYSIVMRMQMLQHSRYVCTYFYAMWCNRILVCILCYCLIILLLIFT